MRSLFFGADATVALQLFASEQGFGLTALRQCTRADPGARMPNNGSGGG